MTDWLDDESLSPEQVWAHFNALPEGGEVEFDSPLSITTTGDSDLPSRHAGIQGDDASALNHVELITGVASGAIELRRLQAPQFN